MDAIEEEEEGEEEEEEEEDEDRQTEGVVVRNKPARNPRDGDHRWTRGPTQLQYDDEDNGNDAQEEEEHEKEEEEEDEEEATETEGDIGTRASGSKSPLRLRGGVGLARTKSKPPPRPSRSPTNPPEQAISSSALPVGNGGGPESSAGVGAEDPSAGSKRPAPPSGAQAKRRVPLGAPGGLRRSSSVPGGGGFKPPRLLPATAKPSAAGGGAVGDGDDGGGSGDPAHGTSARDDADGLLGRKRVEDAVHAGDSPEGGDSDGGNGSSDTQEEDSGREERSQVVVPGWGSQGHHPVEYSESQLSFVTTSQLRASPKLTRGPGGKAGKSEDAEPEGVGTPTKRQKTSGPEGSDPSESVESPLQVSPSRVGVVDGGRDDARASAGSAVGLARRAMGGPRPSTPSREEEPTSDFGPGGQDEGESASTPPRQPGHRVGGDARVSPAGSGTSSSAEKGDVASRWRGSDARLRYAQTRGTPPPVPRQPGLGGREVGVQSATKRGVGRVLPLSPASLPRPTTHSDEPGTSPREAGTEQLASRRSQAAEDSASSPTPPPADLARTGPPPETPPGGEGRAAETPVGSIHGAPATAASQQDGATGKSRSSPAGAAAAEFPTPTPPLPPALDLGRTPDTPLSAQSDNSDMPPLGQPSPGLLTTGTGGGGALAASPPASGAWSGGEQQSGNHDTGGSDETPRPNPGGFFLTAGSGSAAESPATERFPEFTPPTPRPRGGGGPGSETVVLRPLEAAPDPAMCTAALSRLGVPQVDGECCWVLSSWKPSAACLLCRCLDCRCRPRRGSLCIVLCLDPLFRRFLDE